MASPEVVISGMSCRLPQSDSVDEFAQKLYDGVDMITEGNPYWDPEIYGLPKRCGTLKSAEKFDAGFFGISPKQAALMDPQLRIMLELTHETIVDSGTNPATLRGKSIGVFMATFQSEAQELYTADPGQIAGYEMTGCGRCMLANRISYQFDFIGPSYTLDSACSAGLLALCQAMHAIKNGQCEAAVVGAANLLLKPTASLQFNELKMLSPDGKCKAFDASVNGYVRSEGVVTYFLQRAPSAHRIYARLLNAVDNCDGYTEKGITYPSGEIQRKLLTRAYQEINLDPSTVSYVEAHGTGTAAGDPQEVAAIADVMCKDRKGSLLIGSVKSNIGHTEVTSGLVGVLKVILAYQRKMLPGNLHLNNLNPAIPALHDGRLQVVRCNTPFPGGVAGVSSFGFGGLNVHVVLQAPHSEVHNPSTSTLMTNDLRLMTVAGRTEETTASMVDVAERYGGLQAVQNLVAEASAAHASFPSPYRGYALVNSEKPIHEVQVCQSETPPVWFVFPGMGSQWHTMGRDMMLTSPVFRRSIEKCDAALNEHDYSVTKLLMEMEESEFISPRNSFVGITSVQIALLDLLASHGVTADGYVGHSVGELACAYMDGTLTAEQTIQAAYWRGRCIEEANLPVGAMGAIGMTWEEAKQRCPAGVVPACHNAADSVTVSGPEDAVQAFVRKLDAEGTFARNVNTSGVAFHSYMLRDAAPALREALQKIITSPKERSKKWISSSVPEDNWNRDLAKYSSAEYHVNNFLNPVLFAEAVHHIPQGAVVIEVGPHGLMNSVLRRSRSDFRAILSLMKRKHPNNYEFFLTNLGKCHISGVDMSTTNFMPSTEGNPVPVDTPNIASHIRWKHDHDWTIPRYSANTGSGNSVEVALDDKNEYGYVRDHVIDGRVLFPAAGYAYLAWQALAKVKSTKLDQLPVSIKGYRIHRATVISQNDKINLNAEISPSGHFEILEEDTIVASGEISPLGDATSKSSTPHWVQVPENWQQNNVSEQENNWLDADDVYKELRIRGYQYGPLFREVKRLNFDGSCGSLSWSDNWVTFIDAFLQTCAFSSSNRSLRLPTEIAQLDIDPQQQKQQIQTSGKGHFCQFVRDTKKNILSAGGVRISGINMTPAPANQQQQPLLQRMEYSPYQEALDTTNEQILSECMYMKSCSEIAEDIFKRTSPTNSQLYSSYKGKVKGDTWKNRDLMVHFDRNQNKYSPCEMAQEFKTILHNVKQRTGEDASPLTETNLDTLPKDPLFKSFTDAKRMKKHLDIVAENINSMEIETFLLEPEIFSEKLTLKPMMNYINSKSPAEQYRINTTSFRCAQQNGAPNLASLTNEQTPHDFVIVNSLSACSAVCTLEESTQVLSQLVKPGGFIVLLEPSGDESVTKALYFTCGLPMNYLENITPNNRLKLVDALAASEFEMVAFSEGVLFSQFLLRKRHREKLECVSVTVKRDSFSWVEEAKQKLQQCSSDHSRLWLISQEGCLTGMVGFINCLKLEAQGGKVRCLINLDEEALSNDALHPDSPELQDLQQTDLVMNVYKNGTNGSFRHYLMDNEKPKDILHQARVFMPSCGDLRSLHWAPLPKHSETPSGASLEHVNVYYSALNFRDVMLASGRLEPDAVSGDGSSSVSDLLGLEYSGTDHKGHNVMGICQGGGIATMINANRKYTWLVPSSWTLEDAATVPVSFSTAYYMLVLRARVQSGETVLIHSAASCLGQAAILILKSLGCHVIATVGTEEKSVFLQRHYGLDPKFIFFSRTTDFTNHVMEVTNGRGVDVVVNTLAGDKLLATVDLLYDGGRFLELGKFDLFQNTNLGMRVFLRNASFHGVVLEHLLREGSTEWPQVWRLVSEGIQRGIVRPLVRRVYPLHEHQKAFKQITDGGHIGKVLLQMRTVEITTQLYGLLKSRVSPKPINIEVSKTSYFDSNNVYLITGGLGGLGLEMALWFVERGARKLVLTSRSGLKKGYQKFMVHRMQKASCHVEVAKYDASDEEQAEKLYNLAMKLGPVGGIFHLAAVLNDGHLHLQTAERFQQVATPKVQGAIHLDRLSRLHSPDSLEHFVCFSSMASGFGNAGQTNYGYANSFMERVCEQRKKDGFPGLAIQWGFMGDVGIVMDNSGGSNMYMYGTEPQRVASFLDTLDTFLQGDATVVSSVVPTKRQRAQLSSKSEQNLEEEVIAAALGVLGISSPADVSADTPLSELGLDSLMTTEIRQVLGRRFAVQLTVSQVNNLTVTKLRALAAKVTS